MKNKLENLIEKLSTGPESSPFDLRSFLGEGQGLPGAPYTAPDMDKEEAFIRLLCEISAEFPAVSKDVVK